MCSIDWNNALLFFQLMKQKLELEQMTNEQLRLAKEEVNNIGMLMYVSNDVAK